jgi:hypothetical protein
MMTFQEVTAKREATKLEAQRLHLRSQESRQEFELAKGKQDLEKGELELSKRKHEDEHHLAQKQAKFNAAMARYPLLLAQWEEEGRRGPRPLIPDWDYM